MQKRESGDFWKILGKSLIEDAKIEREQNLGVRYSTSGLAISANRLAIRPPHQQNSGGALRAPPPAVFARGRIAKRFALIAKPDVE